jgi:Domain of unknown function (DUF5666)
MIRRTFQLTFFTALLTSVSTLLLSCAGGTDTGVGSGGTGISNPGIQYGTVSGFGSVIVEGNRYDESSATVVWDIVPGTSTPASVTDLRLGMQTLINFDTAEKAQSISVRPEVIGLVEQKLSASGVVSVIVAGQTVRASALTAYGTTLDGLDDISDLAVGDRVEIHGQHDASGAITATRIERIDLSAAIYTKVAGTITELSGNLTANTLAAKVGNLWIDIQSTAVSSGTTLIVGQRLIAWSASAPVVGRLNASNIRIEAIANSTDSRPLRAGGIVRSLNTTSKQFRVGAVTVDYSVSTFINGSITDLSDGRAIRAKGSLSNGIFKATDISYLRDIEEGKLELKGVITDFVSSQNFRVRGNLIKMQTGAQYLNGSQTSLVNGALVEVEGVLVNGVLQASKLEFESTSDDRTRAFLGVVSSLDSNLRTFSLLGGKVSYSASTVFKNVGSGSSFASAADLANGKIIEVRGAFANGTFIATEIDLRISGFTPTGKAEGLAYLVDPSLGTLKVNGVSVRWSASTEIDGGISNLRNGTFIKVEGPIRNDVIEASKLKIGR